MEFRGKTYWIIGASQGLGAEIARQLVAAGADVVISARSSDKIEALAADLGPAARAITVDASDSESLRDAIASIGSLDGMVYAAALYWPMEAKAWDQDHFEAMIDVNLTGAARSVHVVLPVFKKQQNGHIVLIGSLAAYRGLPGAIGYSTSKSGLMSLAETMRLDLRGTGIHVQLANPGFIKTRLTDKNEFNMPSIMTPEYAAGEVVTLMKSRRFKRNFPRVFGFIMRSLIALPDFIYFRLFTNR